MIGIGISFCDYLRHAASFALSLDCRRTGPAIWCLCRWHSRLVLDENPGRLVWLVLRAVRPLSPVLGCAIGKSAVCIFPCGWLRNISLGLGLLHYDMSPKCAGTFPRAVDVNLPNTGEVRSQFCAKEYYHT